ncbi:MAG: methyltransferase domain-containing protein [Dehalococcoidia bacterium]
MTRGKSYPEKAPVEPVVNAFDQLATQYDAWFERAGKLVFSIEVRALGEVAQLLPRPWIEVGTGSGRFARALGMDIGLDPAPGLLHLANQRDLDLVMARGEAVPFREKSIGTLFLIVTICFLKSPADVLKEARRIIKPGGKVVLGLVLLDSPWGQFYVSKKKAGHRFYRYAEFYDWESVTRLLEYAGFKKEKVVSTLFQKPNEVRGMERPQEGFFSEAGFTVLIAGKDEG